MNLCTVIYNLEIGDKHQYNLQNYLQINFAKYLPYPVAYFWWKSSLNKTDKHYFKAQK